MIQHHISCPLVEKPKRGEEIVCYCPQGWPKSLSDRAVTLRTLKQSLAVIEERKATLAIEIATLKNVLAMMEEAQEDK